MMSEGVSGRSVWPQHGSQHQHQEHQSSAGLEDGSVRDEALTAVADPADDAAREADVVVMRDRAVGGIARAHGV